MSHNQPTSKRDLSQLGLIDISGFENMSDDSTDDIDDDDSALEAELLALTSNDFTKSEKHTQPAVELNLDRMIKESLQDIPSDADVSSGEDDPDLLAELQELEVGPTEQVKNNIDPLLGNTSSSVKTLLMDRLKMYQIANQNAQKVGDLLKAKRMDRGITTLKALIRKIDAGQKINESEIPPVVSTTASNVVQSVNSNQVPSDDELDSTFTSVSPMMGFTLSSPSDTVRETSKAAPKLNEHGVPSSNFSNVSKLKVEPLHDENQTDVTQPERETTIQNVDTLKMRQDEYKKAAIEAKRNGDLQTALNYVKIVKQFDVVINEAKKGRPVDLSSVPPTPPSSFIHNSNISPNNAGSSATILKEKDNELTSTNVGNSELTPSVCAYETPKTVMEALEQRMKKYQECEEAAKKENNSSKARRMGRIVQQYKDAIKLYKSGKSIPVDELPTPPGFAPIPINDVPEKSPPSSSPQNIGSITEKKSPLPGRASLHQTGHSVGIVTRNDKQLMAVLERQKLFKIAALKAKQNGDLTGAKEYLRTAKGFDSMIEACKCGLPVDLTSLPLPPHSDVSLESSFEVVKLSNCIEGSDLDVYNKLETDLQQQLEMCLKTRDHYKAIGDIANANRFDHLALQTKKDLKFVQLAESSDLKVPKFHYETKMFTIVQCNTDLTDNDLELTIIQGINYNVPNPKEVDTYVKVIFPYPNENPPQYKTSVIYNTNNPVYNATTIFHIQRNSRACRRIFIRQAIKCEVWSKGGFFRSDTLIGTVNAKLSPLETQCTVHEAFNLMDGRKIVGGKLELKMRIRDPITKKQVEEVKEKWLIIDS